jgi:hypothetical protein
MFSLKIVLTDMLSPRQQFAQKCSLFSTVRTYILSSWQQFAQIALSLAMVAIDMLAPWQQSKYTGLLVVNIFFRPPIVLGSNFQ